MRGLPVYGTKEECDVIRIIGIDPEVEVLDFNLLTQRNDQSQESNGLVSIDSFLDQLTLILYESCPREEEDELSISPAE